MGHMKHVAQIVTTAWERSTMMRWMMSSRNKKRGYELEAETVKHWQGLGVDCERVFASGAYKHLGDEFAGDLMLSGFTVECKRKKSGFKFLLDSLDQDNADILICRQDGRPIRRLYVMEEETVEALFKQAGIIK
tara:strand:+ start:2441 stop:2842 length:402 start_codon:yes stop_codon:yes gene_type:complete